MAAKGEAATRHLNNCKHPSAQQTGVLSLCHCRSHTRCACSLGVAIHYFSIERFHG